MAELIDLATDRGLVPPRFPLATRINSFRAAGLGVVESVRAASAVPGISALELNYPQHFAAGADADLLAALAETGLRPTALNLRYEGPEFVDGAFTSPRAATRERAVALARAAVERAAALGAGHVILWMADDGFDYPFQTDYPELWGLEVEGFRRVAAHDPAIRVSVEPKPGDPRRFSLVRGTADALLAVRDVGLLNFGVTLDFCHSLIAGEHPPAAAAQVLREGRLFGVHLNDGYGRADDGLAVGSVHPWHTLELLGYLRRFGYDGTIYFDTFPVREDPVAECEANIRTVLAFERLLDRLDPGRLVALRERHDALGLLRLVQDAALTVDPAGREGTPG